MKSFDVYGIHVRVFWTGVIKIQSTDPVQIALIQEYLHDEGFMNEGFCPMDC